MLMRMIYDDSLAQAAYLIGCQKTGEAIIIDPERDIDRYIELAEKEGVSIVAASETHIHADFLSGVSEFCEQTDAKAYLSDEGGEDWNYLWVKGADSKGQPYNHQLVKDGDVIMIGNIQIKIMHTPGHTPEHICFEITDLGGEADEPMGIVTGDFVFVGDVGRPDLLESAAGMVGMMEPSARKLGESLRKFYDQPDYLQLWPGHGAGSACGKALGAVPSTTVGYERRFNVPFKEAVDAEEFVRSILSGQPEPPYYFARMKHDNRFGPAVLGSLPSPANCASDAIPSGAAIIDTRPWDTFRAGHLAESYSIVLDQFFSTVAGAFIEPEQEIVLIAQACVVEEAVRMLVRIGLDKVVGWVDPESISRVQGLEKTNEVDVAAVHAKNDAVILDVRNASEYEEGHIPGATNVAYLQLSKRLGEVPKGSPIYVHCRSGFRSARAVSYLNEHGFNTTNVAGGFLAWEEAGFPVER
jgi:hydroxyacylglutathione hydrolase